MNKKKRLTTFEKEQMLIYGMNNSVIDVNATESRIRSDREKAEKLQQQEAK